jgi:hypothetical protein
MHNNRKLPILLLPTTITICTVCILCPKLQCLHISYIKAHIYTKISRLRYNQLKHLKVYNMVISDIIYFSNSDVRHYLLQEPLNHNFFMPSKIFHISTYEMTVQITMKLVTQAYYGAEKCNKTNLHYSLSIQNSNNYINIKIKT